MERKVKFGAPLAAAAALAALGACSTGAKGPAGTAVAAPARWELENPVQPLPPPPLGSEADLARLGGAVTPEKVRLGRWLFYDARLSADASVSCASCHRPEHAFSEPTPVSTGVGGQRGGRKAPTFLNAAFPIYPVYFWDGRAGSLAEQAKGPMANPVEMANTHGAVVKTVAGIGGYRKAFREVYGDERIDIDRVADAIAAYEATRISGNSAWDRYEAGDPSALTPVQQRGRALFFGEARCSACHLGPNLTDSRFHNLGVGFSPPPEGKPVREGFKDVGRYAVTGREEDLGAFKTPTLRDVTKRAPYMHDGSMATLREVVQHYARGGNANPWLAPDVRDATLCACEVNAIVAFLAALDGQGWQDQAPRSFPQ